MWIAHYSNGTYREIEAESEEAAYQEAAKYVSAEDEPGQIELREIEER